MIGVSDGNSLLTTGVYGVVKFVTTIIYACLANPVHLKLVR